MKNNELIYTSNSGIMGLRKIKWVLKIMGVFFLTVFFCEFLIYYFTLFNCRWPKLDETDPSAPEDKVYAMILSDIHMLGPIRGHWFDKLKREWQMHRAFQTALTLFQPEVIFILGDIFDEGDYVNQQKFKEYISRFHKLFHVPKNTKVITLAGNHDVGFHYKMNMYFLNRFEKEFYNTRVELYTIKNVHFITINSMAMVDDGCDFCEEAKYEIEQISGKLKCSKNPTACKNTKVDIVYSKPIILQHFPTYRESDAVCEEYDTLEMESYRENWEVLSKSATDFLGKTLEPRVAFSGHSHNFCRLKNRLGIEEYTVSSFNWRNKNNPSFLLAVFTPKNYAVFVCYMPQESTEIRIYATVAFACLVVIARGILLWILRTYVKPHWEQKKKMKL